MNIFSSLMKFLCTKNCCFCCLVFTQFYLVNQFLLVFCFSIANFFLKKWVCPDSLIYYTTVCHLDPLMENYFSPSIFIRMHLFLIVWIFYDHLWESFLFLQKSFFIYVYLWESLFIENLMQKQPFLIYDHLWESFKTPFLQSLWE